MSDAHATTYQPARYHAKLAVNAATTLFDFMFETHTYQGAKPVKQARTGEGRRQLDVAGADSAPFKAIDVHGVVVALNPPCDEDSAQSNVRHTQVRCDQGRDPCGAGAPHGAELRGTCVPSATHGLASLSSINRMLTQTGRMIDG